MKKKTKTTKPSTFTLTNKQRITIGVWLMVIGIVFLSYNYFMEKKMYAYDAISFELSEIPDQIQNDDNTPDSDLNDTDKEDEDEFINQAYFIGRLEIPKIKLIKGFASLESKENNVHKNVAIMKTSTYPDVEGGNFVLAAHNGNCWNCFFRNVHRLGNGDEAYIYYKGYKYTYKVVKIYVQPKTGTITIYRDISKTALTLITCRNNTQQTVFILNRVKKEAI